MAGNSGFFGRITGGLCWDRLTKKRMKDPLALENYGYKVYSQNDEDGIIQEIFKRIGTETKILGKDSTAFVPPKTFHELMNDSADVVKFLQYYSPSGAEEEYRNWENPKTIESKAQAEEIEKKIEQQNRGPEEIQGPTPLTVPGSPSKVKLGTVKIEEDTTDSKKKELLLNLKAGNEK